MFRFQDHRHTSVDWADDVIRFTRQEGATTTRITEFVGVFLDSSVRKRLTAFECKFNLEFFAIDCSWFVKCFCGHQAAALTKGIYPGWLVQNLLGFGISENLTFDHTELFPIGNC